MTLISPKTISERLVSQVNDAIATNSYYLSEADFEYKRLMQEAKSLAKANAFESFVMKSLIQLLIGDAERGLAWLEKASRIDSGEVPGHISYMKAQLYAKLGYCSLAQKYFKDSASLDYGMFGLRASVGFGVGAFRFMESLFLEAQERSIEVQTNISREKVKKMAEIMTANGVTDEQVAAYMDETGELIRSRRLFLKEHSVETVDFDGHSELRIYFVVGCSPSERSEMLMELAERFAEFPAMPQGFHIGFEGE